MSILAMTIAFVWGMLILFVVSAITRKMWVWHLSWNIVPILAFLVAFIYDNKVSAKHIKKLNLDKKKEWSELQDKEISTISEANKAVPKYYTGLH